MSDPVDPAPAVGSHDDQVDIDSLDERQDLRGGHPTTEVPLDFDAARLAPLGGVVEGGLARRLLAFDDDVPVAGAVGLVDDVQRVDGRPEPVGEFDRAVDAPGRRVAAVGRREDTVVRHARACGLGRQNLTAPVTGHVPGSWSHRTRAAGTDVLPTAALRVSPAEARAGRRPTSTERAGWDVEPRSLRSLIQIQVSVSSRDAARSARRSGSTELRWLGC